MQVAPSRAQMVADLDLYHVGGPWASTPGGELQAISKHHSTTTINTSRIALIRHQTPTEASPAPWGQPLHSAFSGIVTIKSSQKTLIELHLFNVFEDVGCFAGENDQYLWDIPRGRSGKQFLTSWLFLLPLKQDMEKEVSQFKINWLNHTICKSCMWSSNKPPLPLEFTLSCFIALSPQKMYQMKSLLLQLRKHIQKA